MPDLHKVAPLMMCKIARFQSCGNKVDDGFALARTMKLIPFFAGGYQEDGHRHITGPVGNGEFYQAGLREAGLKLDIAANAKLVLSAAAEGSAVMHGSISAPALRLNAGFGASGEESVRLGAGLRVSKS